MKFDLDYAHRVIIEKFLKIRLSENPGEFYYEPENNYTTERQAQHQIRCVGRMSLLLSQLIRFITKNEIDNTIAKANTIFEQLFYNEFCKLMPLTRDELMYNRRTQAWEFALKKFQKTLFNELFDGITEFNISNNRVTRYCVKKKIIGIFLPVVPQ